jgi:hypothetical protein
MTKKPDYSDLVLENTALRERLDALEAENAYLLSKAASELSRSWILHKYWVGIHVALMHLQVGRKVDAIAWLENTVFGPGIAVPTLTDHADIENWAVEQQKDSISHERALEIIRADVPTTVRGMAQMQVSGIEMFINHLQMLIDNSDFIGDDISLITGAIDCGKELAAWLLQEAK